MYRRPIAAGIAVIALALGLTGCWNGYNAQTSTQTEGGDATSANVGDLQLRGFVWVTDPKVKGTSYLSGTVVVAPGVATSDELLDVSSPEGEITVSGAPAVAEPFVPARIGFNGTTFAAITGAEVPASGFITTVMTFREAGTVTMQILTVPPTGPYAQVVKDSQAGAGAAPETAATPATTATPEAAAESPASAAQDLR